MADSNQRRVNEQATYAQTDSAVGAKIGHIANSLGYVNKEDYSCVVISAGLNNVSHEQNICKEWENQTQTEINRLKSKIGKFPKCVVVGVPPAPWTKENESTVKIRNSINSQLAKMTKEL